MRTLVVGDIHGRFKALSQVLRASKFDYEREKLICLGDVVDGGACTYECVEELLKIKDLVYVIGNHDEWFVEYMKFGKINDAWLHQGGKNTLKSYGNDRAKVPAAHQDFFNNAKYYHEENNMLFVHGGIEPDIPLAEQDKQVLTWDRLLIDYARRRMVEPWVKVFIGHTPTQYINKTSEPVTLNNLYCLDTGAGWDGKLTIMDVETDEYWQSDTQKRER